jgi:hypoxanthine phosphoribosyltransferase
MKLSFYEIITFLLAVVGSISSVIFVTQVLKKFLKKTYSWKDVVRATNYIINELSSKSFKPDLIVCLGRGGSIMGGLVAGNIGTIRICTMDRRMISSPEESMNIPDFVIKPNVTAMTTLVPSDKTLQILLITGEVVTGFDIFHAKSLLEKDLSKDNVNYKVLTASFSCLIHANFFPDFSYLRGVKNYKAPPWRMTRHYVNDRRVDKLFHIDKEM